MTIELQQRASSGAALSELLLMRQGDEHFAVVLTAAMEARELPSLAPLPGAPPALLGMLHERGAAIPVFDARWVLDVEGSGDSETVLVIVCDGERRVGLVVDEVEDVIMADLTTMRHPIDSIHGHGIVRGVVRAGERLVAVIDARAFVRMGARALPEHA